MHLFSLTTDLFSLKPLLLFDTVDISYHGNPLFDIAGAYFPAWLACMIVGVIGTWLLSLLFSFLRVEAIMRPSIIMIPILFALLTLWSWLIFFATR